MRKLFAAYSKGQFANVQRSALYSTHRRAQVYIVNQPKVGPKSYISVILAILTLATIPLGILAPCHNHGHNFGI